MAKAKAPEKDNSERWLLTYSDLMNLLLILFIILYCSSQLNKDKAEKVAASMREGFGYSETAGENTGGGSGAGGLDAAVAGVAEDTSAADTATGAGAGQEGGGIQNYWDQETVVYQNFYNDIVTMLADNNLENKVDVKLDNRGIVISFKDNALFRSGSAELGQSSLDIIDQISWFLRDLTYSFILVEGHTDTDPIHTAQYTDNMDLSTQRAGNVWREMVACGLPAEKMASIGYGEYRPVAPNDTPENKAQNRRVVVTIIRAEVRSTDDAIIAEATANYNNSKDKTDNATDGTIANAAETNVAADGN